MKLSQVSPSFLLVTVFLLSPVFAKNDNLPPCDAIPKLLCCTERVLEKCLGGCVEYVHNKCPHKLYKFDRIADKETAKSSGSESIEKSAETINSNDHKSQPIQATKDVKPKLHAVVNSKSVSPNSLKEEGFIEQSQQPQQHMASRSGGDYAYLNPKYPVTEVSDADLTNECGTEASKPPYAPCLSRKTVDDLFMSCCQQQVPSKCHSLCSYEHREAVASEILIQAVQQEGCDMKYMTKILYCANQNRDNKKCCSTLGLSAPELNVGNRCLRMCNIAPSGDSIGTITKDDLVCLSNWNVIMYCARSGLRTIN
uniref:DB domain-containing protein n=1 Tax=Rhabditophanes sp. KR3021 TaxID=114890 RepID=A0AC35TGQ1_9BILA